VAVERLFVNPVASRSLGEFWGRRSLASNTGQLSN
jgi:hypothetical protein